MAGDDEAGAMSEANDFDVEVEDDVEVGEPALRVVDCVPFEASSESASRLR